MKKEEAKQIEKEILDETFSHPFSATLLASLNENEQAYVRAQVAHLASKLCALPVGIREHADKKEFWDEISNRLGININTNNDKAQDGVVTSK